MSYVSHIKSKSKLHNIIVVWAPYIFKYFDSVDNILPKLSNTMKRIENTFEVCPNAASVTSLLAEKSDYLSKFEKHEITWVNLGKIRYLNSKKYIKCVIL
jgi:hypothetical protein